MSLGAHEYLTTPEKVPTKNKQIGGTHYKEFKIQPIEFAHANNLDPYQFSILKYMMRHKLKGGAEDLKKMIHMAKMYLEEVYGETYED